MARLTPDLPMAQLLFPMSAGPLEPDPHSWVTTKDGQKVKIRVVDMTDAHLWRWIRYFRKKYRGEGFEGEDGVLDEVIRQSIVTAPAIYAEAKRRGVLDLPKAPAETPVVKNRVSNDLHLVLSDLEDTVPGITSVFDKANPTIHETIHTLTLVFSSTSRSMAETFLTHRSWLERKVTLYAHRPMSLVVLVESGSEQAQAETTLGLGVRRITLDDET